MPARLLADAMRQAFGLAPVDRHVCPAYATPGHIVWTRVAPHPAKCVAGGHVG